MAERLIIERGQNFRAYNDGSILVEDMRYSFANIGEPYAGTSDEKNPDGTPKKATPKYSLRLIGPKETHTELKDYLVKVFNKILKEKNIPKLKSENKFCKDGDLDDRPEYAGAWILSASEQKQPKMRDRRGNRIDPSWYGTDRFPFYGGCWGNTLIRPWWQDNKFGKKINANLLAVQFLRDDEPFGEGRLSDDDIDNTFDRMDDGDTDSGYDDNGGL